MDKYDVDKLKAVTLYILKKCGATDYIHLFKILYFAEREHYADYGKRITKDIFIAMEHGPVPSFLYNALKLVTRQEQANADSLLWKIANAVTPGSAEEYKDMSPWELSDKSHDEAWHEAWDVLQNSSMNPYKIAKAGGASDGFVEYLKDQDAIDNFLKGNG